MSVQTTTARLVAQYKEISGTRKVFDYIPRVIQAAELPAVVVFPGAGETSYDGADTFRDVRDYVVMLLISQVGQGTESQGQILTEPFFDRVRSYFQSRAGGELDTAAETPQNVVFNDEFLGDDGFQVLQYPVNGVPYAAIQFRHRITEVYDVTYVD